MAFIYSALPGSRLIVCYNVREVADVGGFVRVDVHQTHGLQVERPGGQRQQLEFSRVASSRQKRPCRGLVSWDRHFIGRSYSELTQLGYPC